VRGEKSEEIRVKFLFLHRFILYLIMNLSAGEMGRKSREQGASTMKNVAPRRRRSRIY
jgi:hypothetical protein